MTIPEPAALRAVLQKRDSHLRRRVVEAELL